MGFKSIYKDKPFISKFITLCLLILVSVILHTIIALTLIHIFTDQGLSLISNQDLTNQDTVNNLKFLQLFSGIGLFITPILLYSYLTDFKFKFSKVRRRNIILVITIILLITPFVSLLLEWNMKIPIPEWFLQLDNNSEDIIKAFLNYSTIYELLYTLLIISIVPAIGEELLFRGYLQQEITKWTKWPHLAILITAFLFSVVHLDAQAIIPRLTLGVLLGYFYYLSRNLWLPIIAHFINNAQVVIFAHDSFKIDSEGYSFLASYSNYALGLFSLISVAILFYLFYKSNSIEKVYDKTF